MFNNQVVAMKYFKRLNLYKQGKNNVFNPETCEASSYSWWVYVKKVKGLVIFNDHNYSPTTRKHQYTMKNLLKELGVKIDIVVDTRSSLNSSDWLEDCFFKEYNSIGLAEYKIKKGGVRTTRVKELQDEIKVSHKTIETLTRLGKAPKVAERKRAIASTIEYYEKGLARKREKRKALKPEVNSLAPIDFSYFTNVNNLDSVTL
jgi:hypothetical protein